MTQVTKPIALNESFRTTEQEPRNIADVLASKLESIREAIESGSGDVEGAFICYYSVTSAQQIYDAIEAGKVPYFYHNGIVAQLWKVETNKYTFRTTSIRVVENENVLDLVDYIVNGVVWSTETKTISGSASGQQAYLGKVTSLEDFDTTGKSGLRSVISVTDVPSDGVYQVSVMMSIRPKTASPTKSDLVFGFYGSDGTGMPNTTFHAVVDDSQTFAQQLSFSTILNLKAGTNTLKLVCGGFATQYLVFVDDLSVAQIVSGVYHNGDEFSEVHTLTEALDFNNDDGVLVDGATGGPRFMSKVTLLKKTAQNALAGFAKFTDSDKVNQVVRELYIPSDVIADLTDVKFVRMYNGFGDLYGVQLEGTGGTMLLDLRTSTKSNPHLNGGAGAVVNYDLITGDYERIACNLNTDVRDLAFSPSVKNAIQDAEIQANTNFYSAIRYFSNKEVSKYIKEMYIPSDVLSQAQVASVDNVVIHNAGDSFIGITLRSGNTQLLSITTSTSDRSGYITRNGGHIIFDFTGLTGNLVIDTTLNPAVQNLNCDPTIAGILLDYDSNIRFTDNSVANKIIDQLYIPSNSIATLSDVKRIRVYHGFGGLYGLQFQGTGSTILLTLRGESKEAFYTNGKSSVVINWDEVSADNYYEISLGVNNNVREIAYSPYIKAYMLNKQMDKVVTLFTDDDFLNSVIKELYIPTTALSDAQINSIDNYVLFRNGSLWGIAFKSSSSSVLELYSRQNLGSGIYARNGAYARYNLPTDGTSNLTGNAHLILSKVRGVENSPAIYSYLLNEPNKIPKPWYESSQIVQDLSALNTQRAVVYQGDTKSNSNYVVNAVAYPDGSMIVCRRGGVVAKVGTDGTETTLLTISHASDWRLCWMDKDLNVYVSPHSSVDNGGSNIDVSARGLYKLPYGESTFTKVINLYDPDSEVTTETQNNDDTIWTMCQDSEGNLYAGVYAHTIRANAGIYKSTDGGDTWTYIYNFVTSGDAPSGRHIHDIICNPYDNCLYVIVGEINQIFKSADGGSTWTKTNWTLEKYKGTMLFPVPDGILAGSDGAYECIMSKIYSDGRVRTTSKTWAGTVFAFRKSDVSGAIYAFTKIDSSVNTTDYFPPISAISDPSALQDWLDSDPVNKAEWQAYNAFIAPRFPEDAVRPQHCAIYVSYDSGETWSIFKRFNVTSAGAFGFWTTGQFRNGECLTGFVGSSYAFVKPLVITEGKHKFGSGGLDLDGDIFVKLNSSSVVAQL